MHIFDYSFLDNGLLPAGIVNLTSTISALAALANERRNSNQIVYTQLESIARVQSVKNSNAIEGILTTDARNNANINQLLLIPCVILDFLCIHPFSDGNGRISRLLTLLLLYKSGYDICKYISFEEQVNYARDAYYEALYESSQKWHESKNSYIPFMENFLMTLYKCYKELDQRFSIINGKRLKKSERIQQTVLNSILPISKSEICQFLPDVSVTTIEAVLGKMVKEGTVRKLGQARNIKYVNARYVK